MKKRATPVLKAYEIRIFRNGTHVDTQTVEAENEGGAISAAMVRTRVVFAGAAATYEGREIGETDWREFRRNY